MHAYIHETDSHSLEAAALVDRNAICGTGNGPPCEDHPCAQGEPHPRKNFAFQTPPKGLLRILNNLHEDSTS